MPDPEYLIEEYLDYQPEDNTPAEELEKTNEDNERQEETDEEDFEIPF